MINYNEQDEQLFQSVSSLMAGDMNSYYIMYDLSIKYIYKIIYDIVKDYHTTEDLVQETYITIYNKINTLQDSRKFYSWAGRIATNHTLRFIQNNRRELLTLDSEEGDSDFIFDLASQDNEEFIPENILMDMEKQRLIAEIIDSLSVEQKLAIQYFYYEELSVKEIAELMGCPVGTVKTRLSYARKAIKEAIIDLDVNENTRLYSLSALPLFFILFKSAVDKFTFAGVAATGAEVAGGVASGTAGAVGEGVVVGEAGAVGEGAIAGEAGVVGEGVASGTAGAVGEGAVAGGVGEGTVGVGANAGSASAGMTTGVSAGGAVASSIGKKFLVKIGTSLGAKIATGVVAAGLVVAGGVAIHHVVTENNDAPTEITTEAFEEASATDVGTITEVTTETTTEETTEATTEAVVQVATISKEEEEAFVAMVETLLDAQQRGDSSLSGTSPALTDETVWWFVGHLNNNSMWNETLKKYLPPMVEMSVCSSEEMNAYAVNVFGIEGLSYVSNPLVYEKGDGNYSLSGIQNGDLNASTIKTVDIEGDSYIVKGVVSKGGIYDLNQSEPTYTDDTTYEFTMELVKNPDSPFGFKLISISYEQGNVDALNNSEPPVVNGVASSESNESTADDTSSSVNSASGEMKALAIDPNTTDPIMMKYLEVIKGVCNNTWPDGSIVAETNFEPLSINEYGVLDIDGDGRRELFIKISSTATYAYTLRIYDYNPETDQLVLQNNLGIRVDIYGYGILIHNMSHNHTYSLEVWPHMVHNYNAQTDKYEVIANVEGWEKQYLSDGFPDEIDKDKNGMVYKLELYENGEKISSEYVDDADYRQWRNQYYTLDDPVADYLAEPMENVLR